MHIALTDRAAALELIATAARALGGERSDDSAEYFIAASRVERLDAAVMALLVAEGSMTVEDLREEIADARQHEYYCLADELDALLS